MKLERMTVGGLTSAERKDLAVQLFSIYEETTEGFSLSDFEDIFFSNNENRIVLIYRKRNLVGFSYCKIWFGNIESRRQAVFLGGVFFRKGHRAGIAPAFFGLTEALRFKVKEPFTKLAYLTRTTPAGYRMIASKATLMYPTFRRSTPPAIERVAHEIALQNKMRNTETQPWVATSRSYPKNAKAFAQSRTLKNDPHAHYFMQINPKFFEEKTWLLVWVPLTLSNILSTLAKLLFY